MLLRLAWYEIEKITRVKKNGVKSDIAKNIRSVINLD